MSIEPLALTAEEVAGLLQVDVDTFLRRRPRMVRQGGFPRTLAGLPGRWPRLAVEQWIAAGGRPPAEAEAEEGSPALPAAANDVARQRQALERQYAGRRG